MKMSCATSSRAVIFRIQRRTVGEVLPGSGLGGALRTAGVAANAHRRRTPRRRDRTTVSVYRLDRVRSYIFVTPTVLYALARARGGLCEAAGFRDGGRLMRRLTQRTRCAASLEFFVMTASAPVFSSVRPSGSTKPERST